MACGTKKQFCGSKRKKKREQSTRWEEEKEKNTGPSWRFWGTSHSFLGDLSQLLGFKIRDWGLSQNLGLGVGVFPALFREFIETSQICFFRTNPKLPKEVCVTKCIILHIISNIHSQKVHKSPAKSFCVALLLWNWSDLLIWRCVIRVWRSDWRWERWKRRDRLKNPIAKKKRATNFWRSHNAMSGECARRWIA